MTPALLALVVAAAPVLTVDASFAGFEEELESAATSDLGKKGWNDCGYAGVTEAPVAVFQVTEAIEGLALDVSIDSVLLRDDGKHICVRANQRATFAGAGTRRLFLIDRAGAGGARAKVRLSTPALSEKQLKEALGSVLHLTLDGKGPNPRYGVVASSKAVEPREAGLGCVGEREGLVRPVALLEVTQSSAFSLASNLGGALTVRTPDGKCIKEASEKPIELLPGTTSVWARVRAEDPGSIGSARVVTEPELVVVDTERAYLFDDAPRHVVGTLPLLVRSRSSNENGWIPPQFCRKGQGGAEGYGCKGGRRTPSFFVTLPKGLDELMVGSRLGRGVHLQFIGPGVPACELSDNVRTCDGGRSRIPAPKAGELAVWVTAEGPEQVVLVAFQSRDDVSRLWRSGIASDALSLDDRVVAWHFPFWERNGRSTADDRHDTLSLFAAAPAGLFVFLKKPLEETPVTEPLLVLRVEQGKAQLVGLLGSERSVRVDVVTTEVPAALTLPELPPFVPGKTVDDALDLASPGEQKLVEAYLAQESALNACVGGWMAKHDPTWGKSYELVNVRTGRTMSQALFKQADAACGLPKLERATAAFIAAVNSAQQKLRSAVVSDLRKKLGR